jgi:hypothetical protein
MTAARRAPGHLRHGRSRRGDFVNGVRPRYETRTDGAALGGADLGGGADEAHEARDGVEDAHL